MRASEHIRLRRYNERTGTGDGMDWDRTGIANE